MTVLKPYKGIRRLLTRQPRVLSVAVLALCLTCGEMTPSFCHAVAATQSSKRPSGKSGTRNNAKNNRQSVKSRKSSSSVRSSSRSSSVKKSSKSKGKKRQNGGSAGNVSSAELKRRQENAQREIEKTREEIRLNDASIKKNLSELSKIEADISVSTREVGKLKSQVSSLQKQIDALTNRINEQTARLEKLRSEYLKAVRKMRGNRRRNSQLAFVFSSANLSQAERRMRYLKEFSDWRQSQTDEINATVAELKRENEKLARNKQDYDVLLGRQMKVQERLVSQQTAQNRIVSELRANGTALNNHLSRKQAEVNELRNRVAALIAEEQRKAAEEQRRREIEEAEAQRKREEEHRLNEERRKAALAKADEAQKMSESKGDKDKAKPTKEDKKRDKKQDKKNTAKQEKSKSGKESKDYASARRRKPRGGSASAPAGSESVKSTTTAASGGGFASMKGQLPRPVSGPFRITSQFGRHALPDLPDVVYDNPGIDAEVSSGATATAVYAGKVSGVYMIPGFATVVIVNHGDYYTVYGNIASSSVKVGDAVRQGDAVGKVATDPDNPGHSSIHFEVWKNRDKLNPAAWLR